MPPDPGEFTVEGIDKHFGAWITMIEDQIADMRSLDGPERVRMTGRAMGPRFASKPAMGLPSDGNMKVSHVTLAWSVLAGWLRDVAIGFSQVANLQLIYKAKRAVWPVLHHRWPMVGSSVHGRAIKRWQESINISMLDDRATVDWLRMCAAAVADRTYLYDAQQSSIAWDRWLNEGPAKSCSRMHRMSRTADGWIPSPLGPAALFDSTVDDDQRCDEEFPEMTQQQLDSADLVPLSSQQQVDSQAQE